MHLMPANETMPHGTYTFSQRPGLLLAFIFGPMVVMSIASTLALIGAIPGLCGQLSCIEGSALLSHPEQGSFFIGFNLLVLDAIAAFVISKMQWSRTITVQPNGRLAIQVQFLGRSLIYECHTSDIEWQSIIETYNGVGNSYTLRLQLRNGQKIETITGVSLQKAMEESTRFSNACDIACPQIESPFEEKVRASYRELSTWMRPGGRHWHLRRLVR